MNKTKKLLIDITFDLLYKRGFCATSLMDILKIANVTKGAMYYHFESKNDLVLSTMNHYLEDILQSNWIEPFSDSEQPIETLIQQIENYISQFENKKIFMNITNGCPVSNFILDMSDKDEEFFKYLESVYKRWQESIEKALTKAQILKQTKTDFNSKQESIFIISSIEGSILSAKAYNDINTLKISISSLNNYINKL